MNLSTGLIARIKNDGGNSIIDPLTVQVRIYI
jgi:hypothetical protein